MKELYNKYSKKSYSVDDEYASILTLFSTNQTEKRIMNVDNMEFLRYLATNISDEDLPIRKIIKAEHENMGIINYTDEQADSNVFAIINIDTKYTPKATIYRLKDGKTAEVKINNSYYNEDPVILYSLIKVNKVRNKNKRKKVNDKWIVTDQVDHFIEYRVIG